MEVHTQNYAGIELYALIGVFEWEREALRPLFFNVQLITSNLFWLSRTEIETLMTEWLKPCHYRLLEALAEYLACQSAPHSFQYSACGNSLRAAYNQARHQHDWQRRMLISGKNGALIDILAGMTITKHEYQPIKLADHTHTNAMLEC